MVRCQALIAFHSRAYGSRVALSLVSSRAAGNIGVSLNLEDCEEAEPLNEALTFFTRAEDEALPTFAGHRHSVASGEPGFTEPEHGRGSPSRRSLNASVSARESRRVACSVRPEEIAIPVDGTLRRASASEDSVNSNASEVSLRDTVDFLCGYFAEAISLTHDSGFTEFREFAGQAVARLDWPVIWTRWKKVSTGEEPRMARVVEIAFAHLTAIRDVCERPRRMLVRQRDRSRSGACRNWIPFAFVT